MGTVCPAGKALSQCLCGKVAFGDYALVPMLNVKVVPGASRDRIAGRYGDGIKVQVAASPEDGKANKAVLRVLSEFFSLRLDQLQITRRQTQPRKVIRLEGITQEALDKKLIDLG